MLEPDRADSIILLGSASRGELSWRRNGQTFELLSDYELFAVGDYPPPLQKHILNSIDRWETSLQERGPLFHVDISFLTTDQLMRLPPCWRHFEARETGYVLFGSDLRSMMPRIDLTNLDFCELNQILLWRNWHLVMQLPSSLLTRQMSDDSTYAYLLCRNALDLTTWALPHEGYMIPGFTKRVEFTRENIKHLPLVKSLGPPFIDNLGRWLDVKLGRAQPTDAACELAEVVEMLERARTLLNAIYRKKTKSEGYPPKAFGDYRPRSVAKRFRLAAKNSRLVDMRWPITPKLALFAEGLLEMLKAARNILLNVEPEPHLSKAGRITQRLLIRTAFGGEDDDVKLWLGLRKAYLAFGLLYFPFLSQKAGYWRSAIER